MRPCLRHLLLVLLAVALIAAGQGPAQRAHAAVGLSSRGGEAHCLDGKGDAGPIEKHKGAGCALCVLSAIVEATPAPVRPISASVIISKVPAKTPFRPFYDATQAHRARASPRLS